MACDPRTPLLGTYAKERLTQVHQCGVLWCWELTATWLCITGKVHGKLADALIHSMEYYAIRNLDLMYL